MAQPQGQNIPERNNAVEMPNKPSEQQSLSQTGWSDHHSNMKSSILACRVACRPYAVSSCVH